MVTKEHITDLLKKGNIRLSRPPYGSSLFFVKCKGKLSGIIDYQTRDRITKTNNRHIPRTDEMFDRLETAQYFSKLDLKTRFRQIRVSWADIARTAFKTKYLHFEVMVMPMRLCIAPATFQSLMDQIFYNVIDDILVVYLYDLLVFSNSRVEHFGRLRLILSRDYVKMNSTSENTNLK